jgi:opacity protein-like surface antigen
MRTQTTLFTLLITLFFAFPTFQQTARAQAVSEGNIIIDAYYGWPNLFTSVLKTAYTQGQTNVKVTGLGPFGARAEYMVADRIGVGIDFNMAQSGLKWAEDYGQGTYEYEVNYNRLRAMFRFNYHFSNSDKFDAYAGLGAGYSNTSWTVKTNDPDFETASIGGLIPVAVRICAGGRYFFNDFIGINAEIGFGGGPLLAGGVSVKL